MAMDGVNIRFDADVLSAIRNIQNLDRTIQQVGSNQSGMNAFSSKLMGIGTKMMGIGTLMTATVTAPILAGFNSMIQSAMNFQETESKLGYIFRNNAESVKKWADTSITSFGVSKQKAEDMVSTYGQLSQQMGFSEDKATSMSETLVKLAGDTQSLMNIPIDEVNTALTGIFTGETESLKRLGVVMTQQAVSSWASANGMQANWKTMTEAEKVQLRYLYVTEKLSIANGDFTRTQSSAKNQLIIFNAELDNLKVKLGTQLLPVFTPIIQHLRWLVEAFTNLNPQQQKMILIVAGIIAILPIAVVIIGAMATAIGFLISPIGLVVVALTVFAIKVAQNWQEINNALNQAVAWWDNQMAYLGGVIGGFVDRAVGAWNRLREIFSHPIKAIIESTTDTTSTAGTIPKRAKGGITNGASVNVIGEAGTEAVLPLSTSGLMPFASAMVALMPNAGGGGGFGGGNTNNFYMQNTIREEADVDKISYAIQNKIDQQRRNKGK